MFLKTKHSKEATVDIVTCISVGARSIKENALVGDLGDVVDAYYKTTMCCIYTMLFEFKHANVRQKPV